ncbi:uncharacterized protein LTR77_008025 [Saxophila tyrrhenica]|uniref:Conserved oligomeric Golgi complex subunit 2 n=1 Tax=Saxophila tyrrhenica TaxID=1690608 RepID=A0AAV9P1M3_9PEZI|nr:hypothetical protein LTR77_008025 [Saxophila tyrrhenica]
MSHQSPRYSTDDYSDEDTLPYPAELPRSDFLAPDFDPATYLSTLRNRHQTLEDLRSDLRQRSQLLNKELLDLVNGNYEEFLSLGADLNGGEERVEGVRVGLLGFKREVEGIRAAVEQRQTEMGDLLAEKRNTRKDVMMGRALLEVDAGLSELEERLGIKGGDGEEQNDSADDQSDNEGGPDYATTVPIRRLQRHVRSFLLLTRSIERIGPEHPFIVAQTASITEVRRTLLLDLASALRQAKGEKATDAVLAIVAMYTELGAESDSIRVLKGAG